MQEATPLFDGQLSTGCLREGAEDPHVREIQRRTFPRWPVGLVEPNDVARVFLRDSTQKIQSVVLVSTIRGDDRMGEQKEESHGFAAPRLNLARRDRRRWSPRVPAEQL
jgi:hypothetical protein